MLYIYKVYRETEEYDKNISHYKQLEMLKEVSILQKEPIKTVNQKNGMIIDFYRAIDKLKFN